MFKELNRDRGLKSQFYYENNHLEGESFKINAMAHSIGIFI